MHVEHRPGSSVPQPVATDTDSYYLDRLRDFHRRCPDVTPPSYYAEFGNKCLGQFLATKPTLSPRGQRWVEDTRRLLQEMMEQERRDDESRFAGLELDDKSFRAFAFGTHSRAYRDAGVFELGISDLWKIVRTPDLSDMLGDEGVKEIVQLVLGGDSDPETGGAFDPESLGDTVLARVARTTRRLRSRARQIVRPRSRD